jgi:hypothetical protein
MEKFKKYLELRIKVLKREVEACDTLADRDSTNQDALTVYRAKVKARLSEMEMALEYWKFMRNAKS